MAKLKNILLWTVLAVYIIAILGFVAENRKHVICNKIEIKISDEELNKFLQKDDINKALAKYKTHLIGMPIDSVNTFLTEKVVSNNPAVKEVAAYTTVDGSLCIKVEQRKPILRIINNKYQNYFIDETGQIIPQQNQSMICGHDH